MHDYEKSLYDLEEIVSSNKKINSFLYADKDTCVHNLVNHSLKCHNLSIVDLKKKKNEIQIINQYTINELHPLYAEYFPNQLSCFSNKESITSFNEYLEVLKIDISQVEDIVLSKKKSTSKLLIAHFSDWESFDLNHLRFYNFSIQIDNICKFITNSLRYKNLSISNQEELMNWYQKLKFEINQIIYDLLKNYNLEVKDCKPAIRENYLRIDYVIFLIIKLEKLQQNIEKRYQNCINRLFDISSNFMHENLDLIQAKIQFIESNLKIAIVSRDLKNILYSTFEEFKTKTLNSTVNFNRFNYMQTFTSHFENWIKSMNHANELNDRKIIEFLIEMNFNHFNLLEWITTDLLKKADTIEDSKTKYRFLLQQLTHYTNSPIRVRSMYNESTFDFKNYISTIIEYELKFSNFEVVIKDKLEKPGIISQSKLKLGSNASFLMLLLRYLDKNGVFENATPTSIATFVSEHFYTDNAENLQMKSLRNKFYSNDPKLKKELQIFLQNIISELKMD